MSTFLSKLARFRQKYGDYRCLICSKRVAREPALCSGCQSILPWLDSSVCLICGAFSPCGCTARSVSEDPFQSRLAVFDYAFPVDALLKRFKYQEKRAIGRNLGLLLGQIALHNGLAQGIDILLPVPLAWRRRRHRGFNQASDIAEACSEVIAVPCSKSILRRRSDTPRLAGLSPAERRFAVLGAFAATDEVIGQRVVLIDDVMTSGATCLELNRELRDRGAASVSVWTIARAIDATSPSLTDH